MSSSAPHWACPVFRKRWTLHEHEDVLASQAFLRQLILFVSSAYETGGQCRLIQPMRFRRASIRWLRFRRTLSFTHPPNALFLFPVWSTLDLTWSWTIFRRQYDYLWMIFFTTDHKYGKHSPENFFTELSSFPICPDFLDIKSWVIRVCWSKIIFPYHFQSFHLIGF